MVLLDGEPMVDSSAIISRLAAEKDAEAAAASRPAAKRGWFSRKAAVPADNQSSPSASHTGAAALSARLVAASARALSSTSFGNPLLRTHTGTRGPTSAKALRLVP